MHSLQRETITFNKFDMTFVMLVTTEERDEWVRQYKQGDKVLSDGDLENLASADQKTVHVDWVKNGEKIKCKYVHEARFKDTELCAKQREIRVLTIADGPLMGIILSDTADKYELLDPCVVVYDSKSSRISLLPIFNVARTMWLHKAAIRSESAPAETLLAAYPGFLLQNRMMKHQLRPIIPFNETEQLESDAQDAVSISTQ